jgi:hypothetical protein
MSEAGTLETRKEGLSGGAANYWAQQLELAHDDHKDFLKSGKEVIARYKGEKLTALKSAPKRFNILYSNTETLKAAVFARMATPDIRRRFADKDPIGRQVAEIIERGLIYCNDSYDAEKEYQAAIEDYLLPGRGVVRVVYEATTDEQNVIDQELRAEYIPWDDFRHEPARKWAKVTWLAYRHKMSREDLHANGFKNPNSIPLNWSPQIDDKKDKQIPDAFRRAEVWEIWDKTKRERVWVVPGHPEVLRTDPDPYGLEDFFPNAEPIQATTANDTFIPETEFQVYRDQADGLDEIEARIYRLTAALKRRGVYDAAFKELARLAKANDNEFVPVKSFGDLSTKGGLAAVFQTEDLKALAETLRELHAQRDLRVQTIYEVVGIADIMRGSTDPNETLGAQKIKAQFGGNRLKKRQDKVQKWIRDTIRLKAEILAEHFEPQKLAEMTGFQLAQTPPPNPQAPNEPPKVDGMITPEMIKVLRSDKLRSYRVDIETDSTVFEDAENEKQQRIELITAMTAYLEKAIPSVQMVPELAPLTFETLAFGLRAFKAGKSLEEIVDQTRDSIMEKIEAAKTQPPPPDPEMVKAQNEMQIKQAELQQQMQADQAKARLEQAKAQQEMELDRQKQEMELQFQREKMMFEREKMQQEIQIKREMAAADAEVKTQTAAADMELRRKTAEHDASLQGDKLAHEQGIARTKAEFEVGLKGNQKKAEGEGKANNDKHIMTALEKIAELAATAAKPRRSILVRDKDGRASGAVSAVED